MEDDREVAVIETRAEMETLESAAASYDEEHCDKRTCTKFADINLLDDFSSSRHFVVIAKISYGKILVSLSLDSRGCKELAFQGFE